MISVEASTTLQEEIKAKRWWQGSVIEGVALPRDRADQCKTEWWIISSQTCNLYSPDFKKVPVFELVAAIRIEQCDPGKIKGDNPRLLHVEAVSGTEVAAFEIDIQKRRWLPRSLLAKLPAPKFQVRDGGDDHKPKWLDNVAGWLGRSYTRVALPDEFSDAMKRAGFNEVLINKLSKQKDDLYGIYLSIGSDTEVPWTGILGEMPQPYMLGIMLVANKDVDTIQLKKSLIQKLFDDKIQDPDDKAKKVTRADLARRYKIRTMKADIEVKSIAEMTLLEARSYIRFSFVDHLSDSTMAAKQVHL